VADVIDAMRSIQSEDDRWHLAEALAKKVPDGTKGFDVILDRAAQEGVGKYTTHTLRLYRDTAKRWPASKRVANVSFSAHREAMAASTTSIDSAKKLLENLARQHGAKGVSVQRVREAVQIKNGTKRQGGRKAPKGAAAATPVPPAPELNVLADLATGASKVIAAIAEDDPKLDKYQAGLTKALGHVERLRSKVARKAAAKKTPPTAQTKTTKPVAKKAPVKKARGDLRGL